ncbi:aryl-alcohol oxidase vanillyl-alcohol oxidase [Grosmannia clavigera kw1407]|uniref:Aryl-alcohol oxidase vanillyl-alcohol oxidase n=1 Tax=Grosmannia clavigera (strain kw1407 / UAMH 11150) TaxID=655863 RepID=F0XJF8_GROCL|nr:aryl-alcohol oxidase vanillyl-alcohol oxidase [Grosmannia clavigera kw1407]EFX02021.1 aryl-alcohol oxidase vanillyl-alcohol oxidase [Grosmannia clavigera kw1407]
MPIFSDGELVTSVVVYPGNTEVQMLIRWANKSLFPIYSISMGRNLNLGRMRVALDISPDDCTCLVEPGVSYFTLYEDIQRRGWLTSCGSTCSTSAVALSLATRSTTASATRPITKMDMTLMPSPGGHEGSDSAAGQVPLEVMYTAAASHPTGDHAMGEMLKQDGFWDAQLRETRFRYDECDACSAIGARQS